MHLLGEYSKNLQNAWYMNQNLRLVYKISVVRIQTTLLPLVKDVSPDFTHSLTSNNELFPRKIEKSLISNRYCV